MRFGCATRTHIGHRRKLNQDAVLGGGDRNVWAVADGMGGHDAGEVASAMIIDALSHLAPADGVENRVGEAIAALGAVNVTLVEMGRASLQPRIIGSTVVGLVVDETEYRCFWVGDSRAYRVRRGCITQLTHDHSVVQELVDAGKIEAGDAENHPSANLVTRAVGVADLLQVDTVGDKLCSDDTFLLASDGLTRMVGSDELLATLVSCEIEPAADRLLDLVLTRGAPDNVSLVIIRTR